MAEATSLVVRTGQKVLLDGRKAEAGNFTDDGRVFLLTETGGTLVLSNVAQVRMARTGRLTTQASMLALTASVRDALDTDLDAFAPEVRDKMLWRYRFVKAVDTLPATDRHKKVSVKAAIEKQQADEEASGPARAQPSVASVKRWRAIYVAAGKDVRALAELTSRRGHTIQMPRWIREEIHKAINQVYATQPPGSYAQTRARAIALIRERAEREGKPIPMLGKRGPIGINAVQRVIKADFDQYEILAGRFGKAEADRIMEAVGVGPHGDYPLQSVEVDHTLLDILIVDEIAGGVLGRPWLTVLLDRFSRCITGFALSFHPPSWLTVMEALRNGVVDKNDMLATLGGINGLWDCFGTPDELVCDNGREFHSESMQATEAALNMRILYLPRKKGWLKGKVERWFGTLEREVVHMIPGTTMSNVIDRKHYDADAAAVVSLNELRWLITKWIVDVYHYDDRDGAREAPADAWARGLRDYGAKPPPPLELLVPLTGLTFTAVLNREGIKAKCLRWNSNAFSALRNRNGDHMEVLARIDPLNISVAYVLDRARNKWVEGKLMTEDVDASLTLHQYEVIRVHARKIREVGEDRRAALSRARSEIFDYVKDVVSGRRKSKAPKRLARFRSEGRKPHEHIAPSRLDPDASAAPMKSHRIGKSAAPKLLPPPVDTDIVVVGPDALLADAEDEKAEDFTPLAVKRLRRR